ncbi:MAG: glycosyltransferase family 39 protein [Nanoarchaeota archaeon]|nr:glycosyltransferase family 39 protein [Nanoarchaeota archaeon]
MVSGKACGMYLKKILLSDEMKIFLSLFFTYLLFAKYDGWNENSRLDLAMSIVDHGTLSIDSYHENTGDKAYHGGHYYSDKAPGTGILLAPVYLLYANTLGKDMQDDRWFLRLVFFSIVFLSSLSSALCAAVLYRFLRFFTKNRMTKLAVTYTFGLATISFQYATVLLGHAVSTLLILLAYYLVYEKADNLFLSGVLAGLSFLVDYTNIGFVIALFIFIFLRSMKQLLPFSLGVMVFIAVFFAYNACAFGSPFNISYMYVFNGIPEDGNVTATQMSLDTFIKPRFTDYWYSVPLRVLFYPYRGLFFYNPILIRGMLYLISQNSKLRLALVISFVILMYIYMRYISGIWWGGTAFGPRYLLPLVPFLCLYLVYPFESQKSSIRILTAALIILSFIFTLSGNQRWEQTVLAVDGTNSFTDWYDSHLLRYDYQYRNMLPLENPLFSFYIPQLLYIGPSSILIEMIFDVSLSPWLNMAVCVLIFLVIWGADIKKGIMDYWTRKHKSQDNAA